MVVESTDAESSQRNVEVEEDFVESVSKDGRGEKHQTNECTGGNRPAKNELRSTHGLCNSSPSSRVDFRNHPSKSVANGLKNSGSTDPAVEQVEGVERDAAHLDEGVVASSKDEKGDHIHHSQDTETITQDRSDGLLWQGPVDLDDAECDVGSKVCDENEELKSAGESAHVESRRQLEFSVVTGPEQRGIEQVKLEAAIPGIGLREVLLGVVR